MPSLVEKALAAKRESKHIEFKETFDSALGRDWCEIIKDLVAIANSGGGILVFGLNSRGVPTKQSVNAIAETDPADIANRIRNYVGSVDLAFEMHELSKEGHQLIGLFIQAATLPIVFLKPGTYADGKGQKTAFGQGTVYFRHGAKSEPGSSDDIRQLFERQLEFVRRSWAKGVRRVVEAPPGTSFVAVSNVGRTPAATLASKIQIVKDSGAVPVRLTRDKSIASATFVHEEVSDGIFDEINNVLDANRVLARGTQQFFFGQEIYFRVYAERHHVAQPEQDLTLLFRTAMTTIYAPSAFWLLALPTKVTAEALAEVYLRPVSPHVHSLLRFANLFGSDFCTWLYSRWHARWRRHPQPPSFFWAFKDMRARSATVEAQLAATRMSKSSLISIPGEQTVQAGELLSDPERAAALLSKVCMKAFEAKSDAGACRALARNLDCLAYGPAIIARGKELGSALQSIIGNRQSADMVEASISD